MFLSLFIKWRSIPISVYDWMKSNELRFVKLNKRRKKKPEERIITYLKNYQENNSLDSFVERDNQDKIFDNNFSKDDFLKLTKKWKGENLEV